MTRRRTTLPEGLAEHEEAESSYAAGFATSPFHPDDIRYLQGLVGLPLAPGADVVRLADELGSCIRRALDRIAVRRYSQPPSELRDFFGSLRGGLLKLIAELGLPHDPGETAKLSTVDVLRLPAFQRLQSASFPSEGSTGRPHPVAMAEVAAARLNPAEPAEGRLALLMTLAAAPAMLCTLLSLAENGLLEIAERKAPRGNRRDAFRAVLFANLAGFHHRMFGRAPEFERNRGERDGTGVEWARAILRHAESRIPDVLVVPSVAPAIVEEVVAAEMEAVRDAAGLAQGTLANRLREGWTLWRLESGDACSSE